MHGKSLNENIGCLFKLLSYTYNNDKIKKNININAEKDQCTLIHPCECVQTIFFVVCLDLIADS